MPDRFQDMSVTDDARRRMIEGMSNCLDESIGNVSQALVKRGMW